ncbi:MAG: radical SAM protein, partial [Gammaproteobacteria bacterium]
PSLVLPLQTSRGCYHGKCAFCNVGYGYPSPYRQVDAERLVEHMLALTKRYGVRHIFFADEAISPRTLRDLAAALEGLGSPLHWCGCARFEKALKRELLERMARGGCRMLLFGLETASPPIMQYMAKGTQLDCMRRVLQDSAWAGIWNHTFFFFGFPGETIDHAQETVNFVYEQSTVLPARSGVGCVRRRRRQRTVCRIPHRHHPSGATRGRNRCAAGGRRTLRLVHQTNKKARCVSGPFRLYWLGD